MRTIDFGAYIVGYNFAIGVLVMLASGKIASFTSRLGSKVSRYAKVSVFTFGSCVAVVSGSVYVAFHILFCCLNFRPLVLGEKLGDLGVELLLFG